MPKVLPNLNHPMILHTLDLFFSRGMEEKSPSPVHQSLLSPCSMLLLRKMSFPVQGLGLLLLQEPIVRDFSLYLKNVGETTVLKQKAKSLLRFILSDIFGKEGRIRRSQLSPSLHNP